MADIPERLVFVDLDDSLFSTLRKIPMAQRDGKILAARGTAGKDSFMTVRQAAMVRWLDYSCCIPVTARGTEAFSRVTLPFSGPATILSNGAVILKEDGTIDDAWASTVNGVLKAMQNPVSSLIELLGLYASKRSMDIRCWAVDEPSCGAVYAVAKSNESPNGEGLSDLLKDMKQHLQEMYPESQDAWRYHINGNNLSITPGGISKALAVEYVMSQLQTEDSLFSIGLGDSTTDLEFMRLCDLWMTPSQSQIDQFLSASFDHAG